MSFPAGGYGKDENGKWMVRPPGEHLGDLDGHTVEEHEDLTVSIRPSIVGESGVHFYLTRGIWEWDA